MGKQAQKLRQRFWSMDCWSFYLNNKNAINLLKAEEIKCKLSSSVIKYETKYPTKLLTEQSQEKELPK